MATLLTALRCYFGWCLGYVVSGVHDGRVWVGWRCARCGAVKHYEPTDF
jgi:hypothetical protein